jgi:uracil-DNA glycosylase
VVLALGSIGYQAVAGEFDLQPRPAFAHGLEADLPEGRTVLCSYHVSQQNTFTGRLTEAMFDAVLARALVLAAI